MLDYLLMSSCVCDRLFLDHLERSSYCFLFVWNLINEYFTWLFRILKNKTTVSFNHSTFSFDDWRLHRLLCLSYTILLIKSCSHHDFLGIWASENLIWRRCYLTFKYDGSCKTSFFKNSSCILVYSFRITFRWLFWYVTKS